VIASAAGGAAEIAEISAGILMHPPGDSAALARCIERLVGNPVERASLGAAGRASAEKLFRPSLLADQIVPIFERVAAAKP